MTPHQALASKAATPKAKTGPVRTFPVFRATDFRVIHGVGEGDPLTDAVDLIHEDVYAVGDDARPTRLALALDAKTGGFQVAPGTEAGEPEASVFLDCLLTFMDNLGETREALLFVETDAAGAVAEVYLYPLAPLREKTGYTLITIDRAGARARLAETATVAFTRGTRITLASGAQKPIEELVPGDKVLTRDSGPQALRWIGQQTMRATGAFAPITIHAGALNNTADLVVSPNHRLFVYQRIDALKAGQKEVLVRAGLLVNGTNVTQEPGGFVDYFQLLFDKHEIIYAEGIAAESLALDPTTEPALPGAIARRLKPSAPSVRLAAPEITRTDFSRTDPATALRRLSTL